jgi:uncharacterized surface protein with fasciclin (FAS1) repeats
MNRHLVTAAALSLVLGALAACGGSDNEAETEAVATAEAPAASPDTAPAAGAAGAAEVMTVGGAPMYPNQNIVQNASRSQDHTTLVQAVTAAGLGETLSGEGPFTVFAPTNAAFGKLPTGTVETLTQPANKQKLSGILTYHVVPGRITAADLTQQIQSGGGTATLTTVNGAKLTAKAMNGGVQLTDAAGGTAMVTQADVLQSNGVIHVLDTVLMPTRG